MRSLAGQSGRAGLGSGTAPKFWSKATKKERKDLVIAEVVRTEEEQYKISPLQQGLWATWVEVVDSTIKFTYMLKIPQARLSLLVCAN